LESKYEGWRGLKSIVTNNKKSLKWRDLKSVWNSKVWGCDIEDKVEWVMGDGKEIRFWEDKWVDNETLMHKYPRLYSVAVNCGSTLVHAGRSNNGRWEWKLGWRRNFFEERELGHSTDAFVGQ